MAIEKKNTRQFKCNSCGGEMELHNNRTQYVSCPYCGSVADASSDAFNVLTKNANPANFPPRSFLKLGLVGKHNNKTYKIIGRTCWKSTYQEYWAEDGETGYSSEQWTFDEWLMIDEDGSYLSIIEDSEGYAKSISFIPKHPSLPSGTTINDFENNTARRVDEYGKSEILYYEGESTYLVKPGNEVAFSQYSNWQQDFIAEWRFDEDKNIKEIEFFREYPTSKTELIGVFADEDYKQQIIEKFNRKVKVRKTNKRIFLFAGLINLIVGIILSVVYANEKSNDLIYNETFNLQSATLPDAIKVINDTTQLLSVTSAKNFALLPEDQSLLINLNTNISQEAEVLITLRILDSKNEIVFEKETFACNYKNYQKNNAAIVDGSFNEAFQLNNLHDEFRVQLNFAVPNKLNISTISASADVKISKRGTYHNTASFVKFGIFMIIISLFIRKPKNKFNFGSSN